MKPKLVFLAVVSISYVGSAGCTLQKHQCNEPANRAEACPNGLDSDDSEMLDVVSCRIIGDQVRTLHKGGG
jgi:hypothetical protein